MLKIRMQGMTSDIEWFQKILEEDKRIRVLGISEPFANKGTNKYFRVNEQVKKNKRKKERKCYLKSNRNRQSKGWSRKNNNSNQFRNWIS